MLSKDDMGELLTNVDLRRSAILPSSYFQKLVEVIESVDVMEDVGKTFKGTIII